MKQHERSEQLFKEAQQHIPGGVNSPVRAFGSVGMAPVFAAGGAGAMLTDVDGNSYIDYICSWGPLLLGHGHPAVLEGTSEILASGTTFGLPTAIEEELAKEIADAIDSVDLVRMVNSGTEAAMSAIRLARGYTGKSKVLKFQGCYHGHSDGLLVKAGSGTLTGGVPTSEGVPQAIIGETLVAEYNNLEQAAAMMAAHKDDVAAIIVEPVAANMGVVGPKPGFLEGLRRLCDSHRALLVFDEVITGFRLAYGGAADYFGVKPDLVCLGKVIGGGMPVGAYGGRREVMERVAPLGGVYQAGTLSGNPLAMRMGLNMLRHLKAHPGIQKELEGKAQVLEAGFSANLEALGFKHAALNRVGSLLCQFFTKGPVESYDQVMASDQAMYAAYFRAMLEEGVLLPPAQFEAMFLSTAHEERHLQATIDAHYRSMKKVMEQWQKEHR